MVGLIPITSGDATVNGHDVHTELEAVRRNISVCPQERCEGKRVLDLLKPKNLRDAFLGACAKPVRPMSQTRALRRARQGRFPPKGESIRKYQKYS